MIHYLPRQRRGRGNRIGPVCVCICASVCLCVCQHSHCCVCRSIMAKGLWGEGTLKHGSREVRQRSGVFIRNSIVCQSKNMKEIVNLWNHCEDFCVEMLQLWRLHVIHADFTLHFMCWKICNQLNWIGHFHHLVSKINTRQEKVITQAFTLFTWVDLEIDQTCQKAYL